MSDIPADLRFAESQQLHVGEGLLANAECQSPTLLTDPPHSRASPLPQGTCVYSPMAAL